MIRLKTLYELRQTWSSMSILNKEINFMEEVIKWLEGTRYDIRISHDLEKQLITQGYVSIKLTNKHRVERIANLSKEYFTEEQELRITDKDMRDYGNPLGFPPSYSGYDAIDRMHEAQRRNREIERHIERAREANKQSKLESTEAEITRENIKSLLGDDDYPALNQNL